jgi:hypothetical protein
MKPEHTFTYPFGWLDQVIETTLNPDYSELLSLSSGEIDVLHENIRNESLQVWQDLKRQSFFILPQKQHRALIAHYHQHLKKLHEQAMHCLAAYPEGHRLHASCNTLLATLDDLLLRIGKWYGNLLPRPGAADDDDQGTAPRMFKILCRLSVDQIAVILKAADDTRLLTARSFSLVLRTLVPFLSTERLTDFSWKSARSSTYKIERADKDVAIQALEALIGKIRTY